MIWGLQTKTLYEENQIMPKTKINLTKVSQLRMTEEMYGKLEDLAFEEGKSMASMIRELLAEVIEYREIGMSKQLARRILSKLGLEEPV